MESVVLPKGYRAIWENKDELAVSKLFIVITEGHKTEDFCNFVLYSDGARESEEFMEAHIFGELSGFVIKEVHIPFPFDKKSQLDAKQLVAKFPGQVNIV